MYLLDDFATTRVSGEELQVFFWADIFHQVWKIFFSISNTFKELFFTFMVDMMMFRSWNSWMNWCQLGCCLHFYRNCFIFASSDAFLPDAFDALWRRPPLPHFYLCCVLFFLRVSGLCKKLNSFWNPSSTVSGKLVLQNVMLIRGRSSRALLKREKSKHNPKDPRFTTGLGYL